MSILGVVMAGGRNTRYGGLKAFARVGDISIIERVIAALRSATDDVVIIANDADAYGALGLPVRADVVPTGAALAGLLTALQWSEERGDTGIFTIACDMPFASAQLAGRLLATAQETHAAAVVPESGGRRGIEPLFAYYANSCIPAIEAAIARDDHRMIGFHEAVDVVRVPLEVVQRFGDPAKLFMNVNTTDELALAQQIAASGL